MDERIAIVTDSTSDLPKEQLTFSGVYKIPLSIFFDDVEYLDGVDLDPGMFYEKLAQSSRMPTTAQPAPGRFLDLFQQLQAEGFTHVICIHISRKLSGTAQSAAGAAKMIPQLQVAVIDSKLCCWALGSMALYAKQLVDSGMPFQAVVDKINAKIPKTAIFFSVDNLEALERGGRIGKARALIGKYFGIRPVMCVTHGSGEIEVVEKVRSTEAATALMAKLAAEHVKKHGITFNAVVVYAENQECSQMLRQSVAQADPALKTVLLGRIGGVIGTHLGPTGWGITLC